MSTLKEICDSSYSHSELTSFGKTYYRLNNSEKIICEECLDVYKAEFGETITNAIYKYLDSIDIASLAGEENPPRKDTLEFEFSKTLPSDYMQYLLPLIFDLKLVIRYEKLEEVTTSTNGTDGKTIVIVNPKADIFTGYQDEIDSADDESILDLRKCKEIDEEVTINKSITLIGKFSRLYREGSDSYSSTNNLYKIACVYITPNDSDCSEYAFKLYLEIRGSDKKLSMQTRLGKYFESILNSGMETLSDEEVMALMDATEDNTSSTDTSTSTASGTTCVKCNGGCATEYYIYMNNVYCLDCMYGIVVKLAVDNNVTDEVDLSVSNVTTHYAIRNSDEWKRAVIDKYANLMKSYGISFNITHYMMTAS